MREDAPLIKAVFAAGDFAQAPCMRRMTVTRPLASAVGRELAVRAQRLVLSERLHSRGLFPDHALELAGGQRFAEVISLILVAAHGLEKVELRRRLHALGHHFEAQAVRQGYD